MTPLRRIYNAALGAAGIEVLGMAIGYAGQILLARWLGSSGYGVFAWVSALVMFLAIPCQLGLSFLILRDVTPMRIRADAGAARGLLRRAYQIAISIAALVCIGGFGLDRLLDHDMIYRGSLAVGLIALPFVVAGALHAGTSRAFGRIVMVKLLGDIGRPLLLIGGVGIAIYFGEQADPSLALAIFAGAAASAVLAQYVALRRIRPSALNEAAPSYASRQWIRTAAPFALVAAIDVCMRQIDLIMCGLFLPAADVGRYAVATRLATLVTLSMVAINMLAAPTYAELSQRGDHQDLQRTVRRLAHAMFWPALAVSTGLVIAGPIILAAFGPAFGAAYAPLVVLVAGGLVNVGAGSVGYLANMTGHQWWTVRIQGASVLLNVVLNTLLIPIYGLIGAAVATAFSVSAANIGLHLLVARRVGVHASIIHASLRLKQARQTEG